MQICACQCAEWNNVLQAMINSHRTAIDWAVIQYLVMETKCWKVVESWWLTSNFQARFTLLRVVAGAGQAVNPTLSRASKHPQPKRSCLLQTRGYQYFLFTACCRVRVQPPCLKQEYLNVILNGCSQPMSICNSVIARPWYLIFRDSY